MLVPPPLANLLVPAPPQRDMRQLNRAHVCWEPTSFRRKHTRADNFVFDNLAT
jgi:hypothetical protein